MHLRDYQIRAVDSINRALAKHSKVVLSAATGSGKSAMIAELCRQAEGRVLVLCHQAEILSQNARALHALTGETASIYCAGLDSKSLAGRVVIAHRDSLANVKEPGEYPTVVIDECHLISHDPESRYHTILSRTNPDRIIGMTATPYRLQGGKIYGKNRFFDVCADTISIGELISQEYLCPYETVDIDPIFETSDIDTKGGDFDIKQLDAKGASRLIVKGSVAAIEKHTASRNLGVIFCTGKGHARAIQEALGMERCGYIDGETPADRRERIISELRAGDSPYKWITNVGVLTTGVDIPRIDSVIMLRPTQSAGLWVQCVDEKTEILTTTGWKTHETISKDDTAVTYCISSGESKTSTIHEVFKRQIGETEDYFSIESSRISIGVTGGHKMLVKSRRVKHGFQLEPAKHAAKRKDMYCVPVSSMNTKQCCRLSYDEIRFIGWSITDAHIGPHNVVIYQSTNKHAQEIEELLIKLNFRYGKSVRFGQSNFVRRSPIAVFNVSYANPRRLNQNDKNGCGHLRKYIDRSMPFEDFSERQFDVLMDTIIKADGSVVKNPTSKGRAYVQQSFQITKSHAFIDRLQALCVQNGWRADITGVRENCSTLSVSKTSHKFIGGCNQKDREHLKQTHYSGIVWCISTDQETIVTRRNGRVTIMGNCVGRGLRVHTSKSTLKILELTDNLNRFGSLESPMLFGTAKPPSDDITVGETATGKECPSCYMIVGNATRECPHCGHLFLKQRELYEPGEILELEVQNYRLENRITRAGDPCVVVTFKTELGVIQEWLLTHSTHEWQRQTAFAKLRKLRTDKVIMIRASQINERFPKVMSYHSAV